MFVYLISVHCRKVNFREENKRHQVIPTLGIIAVKLLVFKDA